MLSIKNRFAVKNTLKNPLLSFCFFIIAILLTTNFIIFFSFNKSIKFAEYESQYKIHNKADIVIEPSNANYSGLVNTRLLNLTQDDINIINNNSIIKKISDVAKNTTVASYINYDLLLENKDKQEKAILNVIVANISDFNKIYNQDIKTNSENVIYIGNNIAKQLNYSELDQVLIYINNNPIQYKVEIKENLDTCYIEKQYFFKTAEINSLTYANKYNKVHFYLNDDSLYNAAQIEQNIKDIFEYEYVHYFNYGESGYNMVNIFNPTSSAYIEEKTSSITFLLTGIILISCLVFFIISLSVSNLMFMKVPLQMGTVKSLGASNWFIYDVWLRQILLLLILGLPISYGLAHLVINVTIYENITYIVSFWSLIYAFLVMIFIFGLQILFRYLKIRKQTIVTLSKVDKEPKILVNKFYIVLTIICLSLLLINYICGKALYGIAIKGFITAILLILVALLIIRIGTCLIRFPKNDTLFGIYASKIFRTRTTYFSTLKVVMTASFLFSLCFTIVVFCNKQLEKEAKVINADYLIIPNQIQSTQQELDLIKSYETCEYASNAKVRFSVPIESKKTFLDYTISFDYNNYQEYFNIDFNEMTINKLKSSDKLYIVLSSQYHYIDGYNIGDQVLLTTQGNIKSSYEIIDFTDFNGINIAFTNDLAMNEESAYEAIIIVCTDKENISFIEEYNTNSKTRVVKTVDLNQNIQSVIDTVKKICNSVIILSITIILSLMIIIFSNSLLLWEDIKKELSTIKYLGASNKKMIMMLLQLISWSIVIVFPVIIVMSYLEIQNFPYFIINFGRFFDIRPYYINSWWGIIVGIFVYVSSYLLLFVNIKKLDFYKIDY